MPGFVGGKTMPASFVAGGKVYFVVRLVKPVCHLSSVDRAFDS